MGTFVQAQKVDTSFTGTPISFPAITVTAGNLLTIHMRLGGNVTVVVSDGTNTWTNIAGASLSPDADGDSIYVYYAKNVAGGSTTISLTPSANGTVRAVVLEESGADTSTPADQSARTDNQSGTSGSAGPISTTVAGMLFCGVVNRNTQTYTASTLGTGTGIIPTNGATGKNAVEYHNEAATGSQSGTITFNSSEAGGTLVSVWNFKDAAGGGSFFGSPVMAIKAGHGNV